MALVWTIIIGFIVRIAARAIQPGRQVMGVIMTTLLGIGGSLLAGYAGQFFGYYRLGEPAGIVASVVGALVLLFLWSKLVNK